MVADKRKEGRIVNGYNPNRKKNVNSHEEKKKGKKIEVSMSTEFVLKLLLGAVLNFAYDLLLGHGLEFMKVAMQTQQYGGSYAEIFSNLTSGPMGYFGLLEGFFPWGAIQSCFKGASFSFACAVASYVLSILFKDRLSTGTIGILAVGVGGFCQGLVLSPLLLLKTQVMTSTTTKITSNLWEAMKDATLIGYHFVVSKGAMALMKGSFLFSVKRVLDWTSRYLLVDHFQSTLTRIQEAKGTDRKKLSARQIFMCSFMGGIFSTILTMPLDIVISRIQMASSEDNKALSSWTALQNFWSEIQQQPDMHALTRGFSARALNGIFTTIVMRNGVPSVYNYFFVSNTPLKSKHA